MANNVSWFRAGDAFAESIDRGSAADLCETGVCQIGRLLLMDKSDEFMNRIERLLCEVCSRGRDWELSLHIFAGLGGCVGSGALLDTCYIVREIARRHGLDAAVFGYLFMPDVCMAKVPSGLGHIHDRIMRNSYAALQELDYCMRLPDIGGVFTQAYKGNVRIKWDRPPADVCYLVSDAGESDDDSPGSYEHAVDVTAEYVASLLECDSGRGGLGERLNTFRKAVEESNRIMDCGLDLACYALGASSTTLHLPEAFSRSMLEAAEERSHEARQSPSRLDVMAVMCSLSERASLPSDIYDALLSELMAGVKEIYPYRSNDWLAVEEDTDWPLHLYMEQGEERLRRVEANALGMIDKNAYSSLLGRLVGILRDRAGGKRRDPSFIRRLFLPEDHQKGVTLKGKRFGILDAVDDLIRENCKRRNDESRQVDIHRLDYEHWREIYEARSYPLLQRLEIITLYNQSARSLVWHETLMSVYDWFEGVLRIFRSQVSHLGDMLDELLVEGGQMADCEMLLSMARREAAAPLAESARPLFRLDDSIWPESRVARVNLISVPANVPCTHEAVERLCASDQRWQLVPPAFSERVTVLSIAAGFPICSYAGLAECADLYHGTSMPSGLHLYEGDEDGMSFDDWRELPAIIPRHLSKP